MFSKFLRIGFKRPDLLGLGEDLPKRGAKPLELFFDLAFVVAMSHLMRTLESDLTAVTLFYVILKFITISIFWNGITMYNQYFEDNTIIHRIIIFLSMIPILMVSIDGKGVDDKILLMYTISFIISRLYLIAIWFWASYKKDNDYLNGLVHIYNIKNLISLAIATSSLFFLYEGFYIIWILLWILALVVEILYPVINLGNLNKGVDFSDPNVPVFDRHLQMERSTLFTILILGEGLVGTAHFMNEFLINGYHNLSSAFITMIVTFLILWIYIDYYSSYTVKIDYFLHVNYLNLFQALGSFLIISGFVMLFDHPQYISQFTIAIGLLIFSITNIVIDRHRGEFIYEKYQYSEADFTGENISLVPVRKSFYVNIIIAMILLVIDMNKFLVSGLVIIALLINIFFLVRQWIKYA